MKIAYQQNPLKTIVELDPDDAAVLRLKIIIEDIDDRMVAAAFHLKEGAGFDIARARGGPPCGFAACDSSMGIAPHFDVVRSKLTRCMEVHHMRCFSAYFVVSFAVVCTGTLWALGVL